MKKLIKDMGLHFIQESIKKQKFCGQLCKWRNCYVCTNMVKSYEAFN